MPFSTGNVIPGGWSARHGAVSTRAMSATCTVTRAGAAPDWSPTTGPGSDAGGTTVYTGVCRSTEVGQPSAVRDTLGQLTADRSFEVALPLSDPDSADVLPGDRLEFDTAPENPGLVGSVLRVASVSQSSEAFEFILVCDKVI